MVAGSWEVRMAAAQAIAKIGIRSGEPFRVQCYSILATARGGAAADGAGAAADNSAAAGVNAASRPAAAGVGTAVAGTPAAGGGGNGMGRDAAAGLGGEGRDPLGVAACVGPALEVLDHMYSGE